MNQKDMYSPCSCGSGKKYKFCCYQKQSAPSNVRGLAEYWANDLDDDDIFDKTFPGTDEVIQRKIIELCQDGLELMRSGQYKDAIPYFKKAVPLCVDVSTPANNLALCQFVTGKLGDAIKTQRKSLAASRFPNPFGLVNLSTFCYINGEEEEATHLLDEAVGLKPPSPDACIKVCEGLARFKRHQDILVYADKSEYTSRPLVSFYTGVAAANLGDIDRALRDLKRVGPRNNKTDMVRRYLDHLRSGTSPNTVLRGWPYLLTEEICPQDVIEMEVDRVGESWLQRRVVVDICEEMLNYNSEDSDDIITALFTAKHPDATALLWAIAKGRFGSDSLRMRAINELQSRGELDPKQPIKVFLKGKFQEAVFRRSGLNSDFQFGEELPAKWDKLYRTAVQDSQKGRPNWTALEVTYRKIIEAVPTFYPARFNYAVALLQQNKFEEAEPILYDLTKRYPAYLFAPAALLQVLTFSDRMEEARDLIESIESPEETHPDAYVAWLLAQHTFHRFEGNSAAAVAFLDQASDIDPKNPGVREMRKKSSES